jgi:hypothetical protein
MISIGKIVLFTISLRSTIGDVAFFSATINNMSETTALPINPIISIRLSLPPAADSFSASSFSIYVKVVRNNVMVTASAIYFFL